MILFGNTKMREGMMNMKKYTFSKYTSVNIV